MRSCHCQCQLSWYATCRPSRSSINMPISVSSFLINWSKSIFPTCEFITDFKTWTLPRITDVWNTWLQLKVELLPVLNFDISQEIWKYHISMFRNDGFIFYMECLFAYIYNMLCLLLPCEKNQLIITNGKKVMNIWKMQFLVTFHDLWTLVEIIIWASWPLNISESRQHITSEKNRHTHLR